MLECPKFRSLLILIALLHVVGCSRNHSKSDNTDSHDNVDQSLLASDISELKVPFQGTIRAKQWMQSPLNKADITYTVRHDRIRREVVSTNVLDQVSRTEYRAGVICHPAGDEVLLYCEQKEKKRYCKLTLDEYRELCAQQTFSIAESYSGFGHIFIDMPSDSERHTESVEDAMTIDGLQCDRLTISWDNLIAFTIIETDHCEAIRVDRELLTLVEINLPEEIKGFPLRIRRVEEIRQLRQTENPTDKTLKKLLDKAANTLADGLEKALESGLEIVKIDTEVPEDSAFTLPAEFIEAADISAYEAEFIVPSSGSSWDD